MKYNLFIGRFQCPHKGHIHLFNTYLEKGLPILIAIRDVKTDSQNPLTAEQVKYLWEQIYENNELVKVIIIPDIATVNYGRGVGYEVLEIDAPDNITRISATEIRQQIYAQQEEWKNFVDAKIHSLLESFLKSDGE